MDTPLSVPSYVNDLVTSIKKEDFIRRFSRELDLNIRTIKQTGIKSWNQAQGQLIQSLDRGDSVILEAFAALTQSELDSLLVQIPVLWSDEDDSLDDTLKIVLVRGQKVDTGFDWDATDFLRIASKIKFEEILGVGVGIYNLIPDLISYVRKIPADSLPKEINFSHGKIIIGSYRDDTYLDGDVIIDPGGDDRYLGSSGQGYKKVGLIVDLGGDDTYDSYGIIGQGGGVLGVGIVYDLKGDDRYSASHYSQGAGIFGLGILTDFGGDDSYAAGFFGQGAGNFGIGVLIDGAGNDIYRTVSNGQGFGSVKGLGILADSAGNDLYYAGGEYRHHPLLPDNFRSFGQGFAIGWRPYASGGIGILYDGSGNDTYQSEVYGQGCSYWFSLGALVDRAGNDRYLATEYAQGAGIHYSIGFLEDDAGSDLYYSTYGPAQGEGHDLSVGILVDRLGNDSYITSGGQGIGLFNSIGILIDGDGDDHYSTYEKDLGQGSANWQRGFGGLGLFIDQAGQDHYPIGPAGDDKIWFQGSRGVGIDISSAAAIEYFPIQPEDTLGLGKLPLDSLIRELFDRASLWRVRENIELVDWARDRLFEISKPAIEYAFTDKINTDSPLELRAMKWLAKKLKEEARPYLSEGLRSDVDTIIKNSLWLVGEIGDSLLVDSVLGLADHKDFRIRSQAIRTIGKIGDSTVTKVLLNHVDDKVEIVRIKVCEALGGIRDERSVDDLADLLLDEFFTVRYAAVNALTKIGRPSVKPLIKRIKSEPYLVIEVLGNVGMDLDDEDKRLIAEAISNYVDSRDPVIRQKAEDTIKKLRFRGFLSPHQLLRYHN